MPAASANPPLTMANLCSIAYNDTSEIAANVQNMYNDLYVVWGPVEYTPPGAWTSASLIYIVQGPIVTSSANEFTVVIRGTNMDSWDSWTREDFDIGTSIPFNTIIPNAPPNAVISGGTNTGLGYLINNSNDINDYSPIAYLQNVGIKNIEQLNVTGHSLGGALAPPYMIYLCYNLFGGTMVGDPDTGCRIYTYAGPTPGNTAFNNYLQTYIDPKAPGWRYVNSLDIAPNCWWSLLNIQNIYLGNDLSIGFAENDFLIDKFNEIPPSPNNYAQPQTGAVLMTGNFNNDFPDDDLWTLQASYQHHSTTYIGLVAAL